MDYKLEINDLSKPNDLMRLKHAISELAFDLDSIYTTSAPNGNISARQGCRAVYLNGANYEVWTNVDGLTTWQRQPDYDSVVLTSGNQSISDTKTFASVILTTADINGGTIDGASVGASSQSTGHFSTLKVGTTNQGDVLYDNGTSLVRLTPGTSGYFLQTQGAAANPAWAAVSSDYSVHSNLAYTGDITASTFTTITSTLDSSKAYEIHVWFSKGTSTGGTRMTPQLQFNSDSTGNNYIWDKNGGGSTHGLGLFSNWSGTRTVDDTVQHMIIKTWPSKVNTQCYYFSIDAMLMYDETKVDGAGSLVIEKFRGRWYGAAGLTSMRMNNNAGGDADQYRVAARTYEKNIT